MSKGSKEERIVVVQGNYSLKVVIISSLVNCDGKGQKATYN